MESMNYIQFPFPYLMVQLLPDPIASKTRNYFSALRQRDSQRHAGA